MFASWCKSKNIFTATLLLGASIVLSGCLGAGAPAYTGSGVAEPTNLTETAFGKATISLAPGWKRDDGRVDNKSIVAAFEKGKAMGHVQCMSALMKGPGVGEVLREGMAGASGNTKPVRGTFAVSGGMNKPYFEAHQGTMTSEGQEIDVTFYLGYNKFRYMGCNFGMTVIDVGPYDPQTEAEFIAMFRTLK